MVEREWWENLPTGRRDDIFTHIFADEHLIREYNLDAAEIDDGTPDPSAVLVALLLIVVAVALGIAIFG